MTARHEDTIGLLRAAAAGQPADSGVKLDDVLRNGSARRARQAHRRTAGLTALGTACVVAAAVMATAVLTGPDTPRPADQDPSQDAAVKALALLARPATTDDQIPTFDDVESEDTEADPDPTVITPATARLLTTAEDVSYYAGTNTNGEVCLAVFIEIQVSSSCADLDRFAEQGVWVSGANYLGYDVTALLLPDRQSSPSPEQFPELLERAGLNAPETYVAVAPNLITAAETP